MLRGIQQVHFVGIGGIGMSGLAEILLNLGYTVTGSDLKRSEITDRLVRLGATFSEGHVPGNLGSAGVVVRSAAISDSNVEIQAARRRRIPVIPRSQLLADLMRLKPNAIAVGGTHGKTTTTSIISAILEKADIESTAIVGGILNRKESNVAWGTGDYLVAETDEHDGSFLKLYPTVTVVTNIDPEHMEYYGTLDSLKSAFLDFVNRVPFYGFSVVCKDDKNVRSIIPQISATYITYGVRSSADIVAKDVKLASTAKSLAGAGRIESSFTVFNQNERLGKTGRIGTATVNAVGNHNVLNTLAAIAVGLGLGMKFSQIRAGLKLFHGVRRRFQLKGTVSGITVLEDYAHHPTEIEATLRALRSLRPRRIVAVFQPHLYSRTKFFCNDFGQVLAKTDRLFVTSIYGTAREEPMPGVSAMNIVKAARKSGHKQVEYVEDKEEIPAALLKHLRKGDAVVFLGAGDIGKVSDKMVEALKRREGTAGN
jgi:UDP-N-acetylmuramate--alanine ligase